MAQHTGTTEAWITARAYINKHGEHKGKHGAAHGDTHESKGRARFNRLIRALVMRPKYGTRGVAYCRGM